MTYAFLDWMYGKCPVSVRLAAGRQNSRTRHEPLETIRTAGLGAHSHVPSPRFSRQSAEVLVRQICKDATRATAVDGCIV